MCTGPTLLRTTPLPEGHDGALTMAQDNQPNTHRVGWGTLHSDPYCDHRGHSLLCPVASVSLYQLALISFKMENAPVFYFLVDEFISIKSSYKLHTPTL